MPDREFTSHNDLPDTVTAIRDITDIAQGRQELDQALAEAKEYSDRSRAILSSVLNYIALLDAQGNIIDVNDRWIDLGLDSEGAWPPKVGMHANYLDACRGAADDIPDAQRALSGILSVLGGTRNVYTMTYGCSLKSEERWFVMTVTAVEACKGGAVVSHREVTESMIARRELESTLKEVGRLKDQLQSEQQYLREEIKSDHDFDDIIGKSEGIRAALDAVEHVAGTDATVLLLGETGTGKELFARAIHAHSKRSDRALIKVDCATLPEGLVESELFGHLKGAYTGADSSRAGRFELAHRGTIFLDEIGELSTTLQAKLLRFLQEGEIQRLGAEKVQKVDVRVIAATNRNLRREVFISKCSFHFGRRIEKVPVDAQRNLAAYDWPGNVRELQNIIERSVILSRGKTLELAGIPREVPLHSQNGTASLKQDLKDIERQNILQTLEECHWKIKGDGNAASQLGLKPSTLRSRMKTLGISRP
jgi:transcriptional regulator with GAF, ATPase, and Fis domain